MTQNVERLTEDERWRYINKQSMFFSVGNMTGTRIDPQAVVDYVRSAVGSIILLYLSYYLILMTF